MPKFSSRSLSRLQTCDPRLVQVFTRVIEVCDCTILEGARSREAQEEYLRTGRSKLGWPHSKHNVTESRPLSLAVDVAPYPIDWNDLRRFTLFGGLVLGIADGFGVRLRWGGDWDGDWQVRDQSFNDLPHFEIRGER